jgi:hypothetical protein
MADRRAARRYKLSVPITVWVTGLDSVSLLEGRTCVVSTRGVYFTLGCYLNPGTVLRFTMAPPAELTGGADVCIRGLGKVLQVDVQGNNDFGIAAEVQHWMSNPSRSK